MHQQGTNPLQVCYYKMQLKKGQPYTVWLDQASPAGADIFISETFKDSSWNYDFDMIEPCAEFEGVTIGTQTRWVVDGEHWNPMDEDEWENDDWDDIHWNVPSSWWYYILVKGEPGSTATLNYSLGNRLPYGIPANPQVLIASEAPDPEPIELHRPRLLLARHLPGGAALLPCHGRRGRVGRPILRAVAEGDDEGLFRLGITP